MGSDPLPPRTQEAIFTVCHEHFTGIFNVIGLDRFDHTNQVQSTRRITIASFSAAARISPRFGD